MNGSIGWYRRDFKLPDTSSSLNWIVRFESVNFHAQVWLNGRPLGTNTEPYLPFEFPLAQLHRSGVNRLAIRVENRLVKHPVAPQPPYGWWNYGGLLGEGYLRKVDRVDFAQVAVRPTIDGRSELQSNILTNQNHPSVAICTGGGRSVAASDGGSRVPAPVRASDADW